MVTGVVCGSGSSDRCGGLGGGLGSNRCDVR